MFLIYFVYMIRGQLDTLFLVDLCFFSSLLYEIR